MLIPEEESIQNGSLVRIDSKSNPHHGKFGIVHWSEPFSGQMWVGIEKDAEPIIFRPEELKLADAAALAQALNEKSISEPSSQTQNKPARPTGLMSSFLGKSIGVQLSLNKEVEFRQSSVGIKL